MKATEKLNKGINYVSNLLTEIEGIEARQMSGEARNEEQYQRLNAQEAIAYARLHAVIAQMCEDAKCMADITYGFCKDNAIAGKELAKLIANINC